METTADHCDTGAVAQQAPHSEVRSACAVAQQAATISAEDWAGDEDGEITTPRLSLALGAPLDTSAFQPVTEAKFASIVTRASRDMSGRDWPSAMAKAAGQRRAVLFDRRGIYNVVELPAREKLS